MWGGKEKVPSRSTNTTQSDAWCKIPLKEEFLFFNLVPFFTNFIFLGCFEVGTVDLVFLIKDLILTMMIFKTLTWWKVISPKITQIFSTKSILPYFLALTFLVWENLNMISQSVGLGELKKHLLNLTSYWWPIISTIYNSQENFIWE